MDASTFGGEAEFDEASGADRASVFPPVHPTHVSPAPALDWSAQWQDRLADERRGSSPRNGGVGGMLTDSAGVSQPTGTPVSSRTARFADPLRSLPGAPQAMVDALIAQDDDALRQSAAEALAEQLLALERLGEMLEAEKLRRVTAFEHTGAAQALRSRSAKGFLRTHGQLAQSSAARLLAGPHSSTPFPPYARPRRSAR